MMGMAVPYEATGRREQKGRTREALVAATRELMSAGTTPTVEEAAAAARISRTTAYRYFPNQRSLVAAAHPQIQHRSLLPDDAPSDVEARLEIVMRESAGIPGAWDPQLRASLRMSLEGAGQPVLRQGRAIGWIED